MSSYQKFGKLRDETFHNLIWQIYPANIQQKETILDILLLKNYTSLQVQFSMQAVLNLYIHCQYDKTEVNPMQATVDKSNPLATEKISRLQK